MATDTVRVGDRILPVVPQRHARLRNNLSAKDFEAIMTANYAAESYRVLCVLIPALTEVPLWEWEGYDSQESMDKGVYNEAHDKSPTTAEIVNAFETALMVSGANRLGKILSLVETTGALQATQTRPSPVSLGANGESA